MKLRIPLVALLLILGSCTDESGSIETGATQSAPTSTATTSAVSTTIESGATTISEVPDTTTTSFAAPRILLDEIRLDVEIVADDLVQPIFATARPNNPRLFVADQPGVIYAIDLGSGDRTVVLDISDRVLFLGEQGLLGVAFDPDDPTRMIVHYSALDGSTTVVEYRLGNTGIADPGSRRVILTLRQPATNHNGGMIDFGPDGFLYVGLGDGGGSDDQFNNGQDSFTLLGAILRLDLDGGDPYGIPADNPFADGVGGAPEVWAWGMRNPWRFSFDGTDLWVGDVGQGEWEEIDTLDTTRPGSNAGWPLLEGNHCFRFDGCEPELFLAPVFEYFHDAGRCSVTGGVVYRGDSIPGLDGTYLFGDYCSGEVWGLRSGDQPEAVVFTDPDDVFLPRLQGLTSFGVGPDGEVFLLQAGLVWRLVSA